MHHHEEDELGGVPIGPSAEAQPVEGHSDVVMAVVQEDVVDKMSKLLRSILDGLVPRRRDVLSAGRDVCRLDLIILDDPTKGQASMTLL